MILRGNDDIVSKIKKVIMRVRRKAHPKVRMPILAMGNFL